MTIRKPSVTDISDLIVTVRGRKVILDSDLSNLYGVQTKRLNEQVKRNRSRFPLDFAFQLTGEELGSLRSQIATAKGRGGRRSRPIAFTEHGAVMAANVLHSSEAVQMSVYVVRAFVEMRAMLASSGEFMEPLLQLEKSLTSRLDTHEAAIVEVLRRVLKILDPPDPPPDPPKSRIGFRTD